MYPAGESYLGHTLYKIQINSIQFIEIDSKIIYGCHVDAKILFDFIHYAIFLTSLKLLRCHNDSCKKSVVFDSICLELGNGIHDQFNQAAHDFDFTGLPLPSDYNHSPVLPCLVSSRADFYCVVLLSLNWN